MAIGFSNGSTTFVPDKGFSRKNTPVVFRAEFGDGYEQRVANGINNLKQEFSLNFATRTKAEIDDIVDWFELKAGVTAFTYTYSDSNATKKQ